jgi:hypothetical protein
MTKPGLQNKTRPTGHHRVYKQDGLRASGDWSLNIDLGNDG